jgi:hypothetical protein
MSYPGDRCTPGSGPHLPPFFPVNSAHPPDIPLTASRILNYRKRRIETMPLTEQAGPKRRFSRWCVGACLFLAALFFYNPFFTVYGSSPVLRVQHPLSFRGTVASSELRRSRVTEVQPKICAPEEAVLEAVAPSAPAFSYTVVPQQEPPDFQPQTFSESLWFRPPPVS